MNFIRFILPQGEIDFIAAPPITPLKPDIRQVAGMSVNVEQPAEIIAKKIFHRGDVFKPRDLFDLAVVYTYRPSEVCGIAPFVADKLESFSQQLDRMESSGLLPSYLEQLAPLEGGQKSSATKWRFAASAFRTWKSIKRFLPAEGADAERPQPPRRSDMTPGSRPKSMKLLDIPGLPLEEAKL
jgi:hypothetical protein